MPFTGSSKQVTHAGLANWTRRENTLYYNKQLEWLQNQSSFTCSRANLLPSTHLQMSSAGVQGCYSTDPSELCKKPKPHPPPLSGWLYWKALVRTQNFSFSLLFSLVFPVSYPITPTKQGKEAQFSL